MASVSTVFARPKILTEQILRQRIASLPITSTGCILWPSRSTQGYAPCSWRGKPTQIHRVLWELAHGPLPKGERLVNKCGNKHCVTLSHWQPKGPLPLNELPPCPKRCSHGHRMSPQTCTIENKRRAGGVIKIWRCSECRRDANRQYQMRLQRRFERGMELPASFNRSLPAEQLKPPRVHERSDVCLHGHPRTPENTRVDRHGYKRCKVCAANRLRAVKQTGAPTPVPDRATHCRNGHAYTPETARVTPEGWRRCRICQTKNRAAHYQRHKQSQPVTGTQALPSGQTV